MYVKDAYTVQVSKSLRPEVGFRKEVNMLLETFSLLVCYDVCVIGLQWNFNSANVCTLGRVLESWSRTPGVLSKYGI